MVRLLFIILSIQSPEVDSDRELVDTIDALNAGINQWQTDICFRSTFRLRQGYAKSLDDALRSGVDPSIPGPPNAVFEAAGIFNKRFDLYRYRIDYGRAPVVLQSSPPARGGGDRTFMGASQVAANPSFDEMSDGRIQVRYDLNQSGNVVHVTRQRLDAGTGAGVLSEAELTPIRPYMNPRFRPFELWRFGDKADESPLFREAKAIDNDHLDVVIRQDGNHRQFRRIRMRISVSPPVITEIDERSGESQRDLKESYIRLSDFQDCPGGFVARRIRSIQRHSGKDQVRVRDWESTDLGAITVADADFVMKLGANTPVRGLEAPPSLGDTDRSLSLTRIRDDDLSRDNTVWPPQPGYSRWNLFIIANTCLLAAIIAAILLRIYLKARWQPKNS